MRCPKCHSDNPDTKQFCGDCGTQLKSSEGLFISETLTVQKPSAISGKTISGKYEVIKEIGRGGMGIVFQAKDIRLNRTVALKFLAKELTRDSTAMQRFLQEAQAAAALDHPNICTVYEVDDIDDQMYISMNYIEGKSLKEKLEDEPLEVDEAVGIVLQVAEGLKEAHEKGIVHRDVKPSNIMISDKGRAIITDFGLAKLSWGADLTKASTIMGTVAYMSPEQARGDDVDQRTDIWSLGAVFYEILTGKPPFKNRFDQAAVYAILNEDPTPISSFRSVPTR